MAVFAPWSHLPLRIFLISACVLSSALFLRSWLPTVVEFVTTELPSLYATVSACLRPPYLYILINCIILCIVASSKLQHGRSAGEAPIPMQKAVAEAVPVEVIPKEVDVPLEYAGYEGGYVYGVAVESVVTEAKAEEEEEKQVLVEEAAAVDVTDVVVPGLIPELERNHSAEFAVMEDMKEKEEHAVSGRPPFSTRFGHRRSAKSSPEVGKSLRVSKSRRHDTLESTWKTITDGRAMPLTRHLKKSDTWETHARRSIGNDEKSPPYPKTNKSETFREETGGKTEQNAGQEQGKVRREPSLGQEELNRRVEAFIRKFNEEMRLQREESLNQFQEMITRGAD
ncbi:hypothetical protein MLD38_035218 [Melastoma candidum]|uniref:Uncharacterized protein n=1 Tax=Melastoma candidum TaxID=119954 RepID=A0ACB9MG06_9MYRT|nr:hypothetical protein MLD38_035218 [Melastoma candidum]